MKFGIFLDTKELEKTWDEYKKVQKAHLKNQFPANYLKLLDPKPAPGNFGRTTLGFIFQYVHIRLFVEISAAMSSESYNQLSSLMRRGAFREALDLAQREASAAPAGNEFWLTQQARAHMRCKEPGKALACARQALAISPGNPFAVLTCADAERESGDFHAALQDYRSQYDNPRVEQRAREGAAQCLAKLEHWEEVLAEAVHPAMNPDQGLQWKVEAFRAMRRNEEAMTSCRDWLAIRPDNPRALWKLTEMEIERDGLEPVRARMGRMARIPGRPPIYGEIYASLCRRAGLEDRAIEQYEKLARGPVDPRIARKRAFSLTKTNRHSEAIPILEEVLRDDPTDQYAHTSYTAACKKTGDVARAEDFYTELLERYPQHKGLYTRRKKMRAGRETHHE